MRRLRAFHVANGAVHRYGFITEARRGLSGFDDFGDQTKQFAVELLGGLGDDADIGDDGHEVGIPIPAGDEVLVEVAGHAGAGTAAEVDADIEALGGDGAFEQFDGEDGLVGEVGEFIGVEFAEVGFVGLGGDEEMAVGIGEAVHEDDHMGSLPEDAAVGVLAGRGGGGETEEAAVLGFFERTNVIHAPGGKERGLVHMGF